MKRPTTRAIKFSSDDGFRFSNDAVAEIRNAVGDSARLLTSRLQTLIDDHLSPIQAPARNLGDFWPHPDPTKSEIVKMIKALRGTIQCIDGASLQMQMLLRTPSMRDLLCGQTTRERLTGIRVYAAACIRLLERKIAGRRKRGRPTNTDVKWLSKKVALVVSLSGIRVTTSRAGKFAQVLSTVLVEVYGSAPDDLFRLVQIGSHFLKETTQPQLCQGIEFALPYMANRPFWTNLLQVLKSSSLTS